MSTMPDAATRAHRLSLVAALRPPRERIAVEVVRSCEACSALMAAEKDLDKEINVLDASLREATA